MHLHKWLPWQREHEIEVYGDGWGAMTDFPTRHEVSFLRTCSRCGKPQTKRVQV